MFASKAVVAALDSDEQARLTSLQTGDIVADDSNHIVFVNDAAAAILGWEAALLTGYRLLEIIPPHLRASHLAGFTRHSLTGESRLLGRPVQVPALRRDASTIEIELTIEQLPARRGRTAYLATMRAI